MFNQSYQAANEITVEALKRETILRQVVERPLRSQIQSLDGMNASKDRSLQDLNCQLSQAKERVEKEEHAKVRQQAKLYESVEKCEALQKRIDECQREKDILTDTAQRAEKSKAAAQHTTEEMAVLSEVSEQPASPCSQDWGVGVRRQGMEDDSGG